MLIETLQMLRTVPHLALTPLFILWFGLGEVSKVLLIGLGAFFPIYVNTLSGIRGVDKKLIDVSRILEFTALKTRHKTNFPSCFTKYIIRGTFIPWCCLARPGCLRINGSK